MAIARFSFSLVCPVNSARRRGRSPASNCSSSACASPEISCRSGMCYQITVPVRERAGRAARTPAGAPPALALRTAASACGRAQPRFSSAESTSWSMGESARPGRPRLVLRRPARAACRAIPAPCAPRSSCPRPGICTSRSDLAAADGGDQVGRRQTGEDLHRQRRADAAHRDQLLEQRLLVLRQEAVQRQRVFADVRMDPQAHFGARVGQLGERGDGDGHVVPDPAGLHDGLVGMLLDQHAAQ